MTRSIDHIVATHRHAAKLRAQGKNIWPHQAAVLSVIQEAGDDGPANLADKANRIAKVLRASLPAKFFDITGEDYDFGFVDAVEALESYTEASLADEVKTGADITEEFNGWLAKMHDWADRNRVWLDGRSASQTESAQSTSPRPRGGACA